MNFIDSTFFMIESSLCFKITANDFLFTGFTAYLIITDTITRHIYAHIRRALVWRLPEDPFKNVLQYREDFHIPVVIDSYFIVCLQMERIDHINILQVGRSRFIG